MEGTVYLMCLVMALVCCLLLFRGYWRSGARLLLWCGLFFLALVAENAILFANRIVVPDLDLSVLRLSTALVGTMLLLYGLIWEVR